MSMSSKYPGKCKLCKVAFTAGTTIYKEADHWCSVQECAKKSMTQSTPDIPQPTKRVTPAATTDSAFIRDATVKLYAINQQVQETLKAIGETDINGGMVGQFTKIIYHEMMKKETGK